MFLQKQRSVTGASFSFDGMLFFQLNQIVEAYIYATLLHTLANSSFSTADRPQARPAPINHQISRQAAVIPVQSAQ